MQPRRLLTGLPQCSFYAWLFIGGTAVGAWAASHLVIPPWFRGAPKISGRPLVRSADAAPGSRQSLVGAVVAVALLVLAGYQLTAGHTPFAGVLPGRGAVRPPAVARQICFTASLRDLWLTGRGTMAKAILAGMALECVLTALSIGRVQPLIIHWAGPGAVIRRRDWRMWWRMRRSKMPVQRTDRDLQDAAAELQMYGLAEVGRRHWTPGALRHPEDRALRFGRPVRAWRERSCANEFPHR